jgi:hypothetical protein
VAALAAVALPLAVVAAVPGGGDDDSLRAANAPTAPPGEASPTPAAEVHSPGAEPSAQPEPQPTASAPSGGGQPGTAPPQQSGQPAPAGAPTPTPAPQQGPHSKTGVDDQAKTLKVLVHTPGSGGSAASGARKYWESRSVKGYRVQVEPFEGTRSACEQKAQEGFLVVGAVGPEQTQACAGAPAVRAGNLPYLAPGSVETGLRDLTNHFALSLTYRAQARRLVAMADKGGYLRTRNGKGWALVLSDTPAATEAEPALVAALEEAGEDVTVVRVPRTGADAGTVANELREGQYESVYFHGSPLFFIELTGRTGCPGYCPQWTGVGVSANVVGLQACNVTGRAYKGEFLSPHPGLDEASGKAPGVTFADDAELSSYGSMQLLDQMLQAVPGPSFTREAFLDAVAGSSFAGGVHRPVSFASSRFGGTQAYALRMDCARRQHVTTGVY